MTFRGVFALNNSPMKPFVMYFIKLQFYACLLRSKLYWPQWALLLRERAYNQAAQLQVVLKKQKQ